MSHQKNVTVSKSITSHLDSCSICFAVTFSSSLTSKNSSQTFQLRILRKLSTVHCDRERKCQLARRCRLNTEAKCSYFLVFLTEYCSIQVYRNSYMRAKFFNIFQRVDKLLQWSSVTQTHQMICYSNTKCGLYVLTLATHIRADVGGRVLRPLDC
jgi:hypothetical protein